MFTFKRQILFAVLLFIFCIFTTSVLANEYLHKGLNSGWSFFRFEAGDTFDPSRVPDEGWSRVTLPHTARIEPRVVNEQWQGDALYRIELTAQSGWEEKTLWLRFEAAMMVAEVYLNGLKIQRHTGGYLPFTVDLSGKLKVGEGNEILVHLDNRDNPLTGPKPLEILDFNTYGGLYRGVSLQVRDRLHISDEMLEGKVAGGGIFITYPEVSKKQALVSVTTHVRNTGEHARTFSVRQALMDGAKTVAESMSGPWVLEPGADIENLSQIPVLKPRLWSPTSPGLYQLVTQVVSGKQTVDERSTAIGIRRISFDGSQFSINGETRFLRGVNRHQEYPYVGYALSPEADHRDARLIKEAGFDYVRLSHYPHSPHFMKAADELGLVLVNAILGWQYYNPDPAFSRQVEQTCRDLIRRDRNHPSVIAWECSLNESAMPDELVARLHRTVHEEYPGDQAFSAGWVPGYDIYLQARQHRLQHYQEPDRPYIVSEYGDWEYYAQNAGLNQDAWDGLKEEQRTSRQPLESGERRLLQQATNIQEAHNDNFNTPAFADGYWVMFDYNRGYADDLETSGVMSVDRVPKFSYYFFRSQRDPGEKSPLFNSGPMLKTASYWSSDSSLNVRVFSNVEEVELWLNGRSLGRQKPDQDRISKHLAHPPFTFQLERFEPGKLVAVGFISGREVVREVVTTPGDATGIELALMDQGVPLAPGDLVFLRARLVDNSGQRVPANGVTVTFSTDCPSQTARIVSPLAVSTEAGVASALIRFLEPKTCGFTAAVEGQSWTVSVPALAEPPKSR